MEYSINPELKTHRAMANTDCCNDTIVSTGGGKFQSCKCGQSFIDQERFLGLYIRLGGRANLISAECPPTCKLEEHKQSK